MDAQLEQELRDLRDLVGATFCAIVGGDRQKQEDWLQMARDSEYARRYFGGVMGTSFWGNGTKEIPQRAQEALRRAGRRGSQPPLGGYLNLTEVACAGREAIAAIDGVGPKALAAIDAALEKQGLKWAEGGEG